MLRTDGIYLANSTDNTLTSFEKMTEKPIITAPEGSGPLAEPKLFSVSQVGISSCMSIFISL